MKNDSKPQNKIPVVDPPFYFDSRDSSYWYQLGSRFIKMTARDLGYHLKADHGLKDNEYCFFEGGGCLNQLEAVKLNAMKKFLIDYAGPLAGHRKGIFSKAGSKFLVTDEPDDFWKDIPKKMPEPKFFISFIQELLGEHDQWQFLAYWLHFALKSLHAGDFRPGQCAVLAGEASCGKSLLQLFITEILGGRAANPLRYLMDKTQFNLDLARSEHWMMEDPQTSTDIKTRRIFGAMIKEATVNLNISVHQKGKDAIPLPVFRRLTISVNDEAENLCVIPPLDDSLKAKFMLFLCAKVQKCFEPYLDKNDEPDRKKIWADFIAELPAIRSWLLHRQPALQKSLREIRCGIIYWHHPRLLETLDSLSQEARLLALMDEVLWADADDKDLHFVELRWMELEDKLRKSSVGFEFEKLNKWQGATATLMGRLTKAHPDRVSKIVSHGYATWRITKPKPQPTEDKNQLDLGVSAFAVQAGLVKK